MHQKARNLFEIKDIYIKPLICEKDRSTCVWLDVNHQTKAYTLLRCDTRQVAKTRCHNWS